MRNFIWKTCRYEIEIRVDLNNFALYEIIYSDLYDCRNVHGSLLVASYRYQRLYLRDPVSPLVLLRQMSFDCPAAGSPIISNIDASRPNLTSGVDTE
jgi:hypothetical protein